MIGTNEYEIGPRLQLRGDAANKSIVEWTEQGKYTGELLKGLPGSRFVGK